MTELTPSLALSLPEQAMLSFVAFGYGMPKPRRDSAGYAAAAACLVELLLRERVAVEKSPWLTAIRVIDPTPTADPSLDRLLDGLAHNPFGISGALALGCKHGPALVTRLIERGIVHRAVRKRRVGPDKATLRVDPGALRDLDDQILTALAEPASAQLSTVALAAILQRSYALSAVQEGARPGEYHSWRGKLARVRDLHDIERRAKVPPPDTYAQIKGEPVATTCAAIAIIATAASPPDS